MRTQGREGPSRNEGGPSDFLEEKLDENNAHMGKLVTQIKAVGNLLKLTRQDKLAKAQHDARWQLFAFLCGTNVDMDEATKRSLERWPLIRGEAGYVLTGTNLAYAQVCSGQCIHVGVCVCLCVCVCIYVPVCVCVCVCVCECFSFCMSGSLCLVCV